MSSFKKTGTVTTDISDYNKMIVACLKAHFKNFRQRRLYIETIKTLIKTPLFMILNKT